MKQLQNLYDRKQIYLVEAARLSFFILKKSYDELIKTLREIEVNSRVNYEQSILSTQNVWQFVDYSYRLFMLMGQIPGLSQRDTRYQVAQRNSKPLDDARNFFQHLNSSVSKLEEKSYPLIGAIAWPSSDLKSSFVITMGTLPAGTQLATIAYDTWQKEFTPHIWLHFGNFAFNVSDCFSTMQKLNEYLNDWLKKLGALSANDGSPTFMAFGTKST